MLASYRQRQASWTRRVGETGRKMAAGMKTTVRVVLFICMIVVSGAKAQTYEEVRDKTGAFVRFGMDYAFSIATESGVVSPTTYYFGDGGVGDPVHTDTEITMGYGQDNSTLMACVDGNVTLIPKTDTTPQNALIRVRRDSDTSAEETNIFYHLDITETANITVQFGERSLRCDSGPGTSFQFVNALTTLLMPI